LGLSLGVHVLFQTPEALAFLKGAVATRKNHYLYLVRS